MAAKIHPIVSEPLDTKTQMTRGPLARGVASNAWLEPQGLEPEQVDEKTTPTVASNAWLEPEQVDEGLETTPTTRGVACNDWSAMLPNLFFCIFEFLQLQQNRPIVEIGTYSLTPCHETSDMHFRVMFSNVQQWIQKH